MNGSLFLSRSVASLTNDDSKILGNIKPKLKKLEEQYNIQSLKFKTVNSSWTPLVNKTANRTVFEERCDLASHWFDLWSDKQRKWFLLNIFSRLRPPQISYMENVFESFGIYERRDFTRVLPTNLSKLIFSHLSPQDLSRCAQVTSHWKFLSENDDIWKPKCLKFGWYLPYEPLKRELGAWKTHYIECVLSINAQPLSKKDAFKFREALYERELTSSEKEEFIYHQTKRNLTQSENYEIQSSRKPWQPNNTRPTELKKSDKLLYSSCLNLNRPTETNSLNTIYKTQFGLPLQSAAPHLRDLSPSRSITGYMLDDLRNSLPLHVLNIKESYRQMRKSENDYFATKLSSASTRSYLMNKKIIKSNSLTYSNNTTNVQQTSPHVIFISSKVPCCHLLLDSLNVNTIGIPYDFESTNINTLIKILNSELNGRLATSIGLFLHFDKPGQLPLTSDKALYSININSDELSNFLMQLKDSLHADGILDFFSPLGSSVDGLELADKIQKLTGIKVRVPTGYLTNYRFVKSKWINDQSTVASQYFNEKRLEIWLNYCEILTDAHDMICSRVLAGYNDGNSGLIDNVVLKKICGRLVFNALESTSFLVDLKMQTELSELISKSAQINSGNFLKTLSNVLVEVNNNREKISQDDAAGEILETKNEEEMSGEGEKRGVMRSDAALRSFLRNKSLSEDLEPGLRIEIALELTHSEINYLKQLEKIQKFYATPLKASLNAGRKIISQSTIDLLFNDLAIMYNLTKDIVKDLNLRIKNWQVDCCVADVLNKLTSSLQCYINLANNYDTILSTLDKLKISNPRFRLFLVSANKSSGLIPLQDLIQTPWTRIKEYMNLLAVLQLHTPDNHPDHPTITSNIKKIREVYLFIKQLQDRLKNKHDMATLQMSIVNSPKFIKDGRYLILRENCILINRMTFAYVKDLTVFLFNDGIMLAYRVTRHLPFTKFTEESLVYYELVEDLLNMTILDVSDLKHMENVVHLKFNKYDDFYLAFDTYERKYNFLKLLKLASELAVQS